MTRRYILDSGPVFDFIFRRKGVHLRVENARRSGAKIPGNVGRSGLARHSNRFTSGSAVGFSWNLPSRANAFGVAMRPRGDRTMYCSRSR